MPPKKPTIFNERGEEALGTVGPYMIGDSVSLKCIAVGGELSCEECPGRLRRKERSTFTQPQTGMAANLPSLAVWIRG